MPINTEALKDSVNGHKPKAKRPNPNPEQQQQRLSELNAQTSNAISVLAQTGVNTINAQVFAFDVRLTQFERGTGKVLADRLQQSQIRIQQYLVEELTAAGQRPTDLAGLLGAALEMPDLSSEFLAIDASGCVDELRCSCKPMHMASGDFPAMKPLGYYVDPSSRSA